MLHFRNCTAQRLILNFRMDYKPEGREARIEDRRNYKKIMLAPWDKGFVPLDAAQMTNVIDQMIHAGGVLETDVPNGLGDHPYSFIMNVDREVTMSAREALVQHNRAVKTDEGAERRKQAGLAANNSLIKSLVEQGVPEDIATPRETTIEYEGEEEREGQTRLAHGVTVKNRADGAARAPRGGRARGG
jgi:hypothetical protein